jgi:hypothetical protein
MYSGSGSGKERKDSATQPPDDEVNFHAIAWIEIEINNEHL